MIKAGFLYFLAVFAMGFILGTLRVLLLIPKIGEVPATLLEVPLILAFSWLVSRWTIRKLGITLDRRKGLQMGALALCLLMGAEFLLSISLFQRSPEEFLPSLMTAAGIIGLGGQILFALIPLLQALQSEA